MRFKYKGKYKRITKQYLLKNRKLTVPKFQIMTKTLNIKYQMQSIQYLKEMLLIKLTEFKLFMDALIWTSFSIVPESFFLFNVCDENGLRREAR